MFYISLVYILVIIIYSSLLLITSFFIFGAKLPKASRGLLSVIEIQGKLRHFYSLLIVTSSNTRSSHPEVLSRKGVLKKCSKFTGEYPCRCAISKKLQSNFIEITRRYGCSPVNLLHVFRTRFYKNTSGCLLL